VAQFRVEFVLDQTTGKYLAELYHPERQEELVARTEARFPSPEAAVLGVVQLFKNAIPPRPTRAARKKPAGKAPVAKKRRAARAGTSGRQKRRKRR
jgi:hypothetical protein